VDQEELTKEAVEKLEGYDALKNKNLEELEELEDEFDDKFLEEYKNKKLAELQIKSDKK
jgi:hypothetical protein